MRLKNRSGFSLIELLTVIAIIAILAAVIFPVMGTAREKARQSQCISNLNALQQALKLYKNDNNRYPPVLFGFAQAGMKVDDVSSGALFREYVKSAKGFACPDSRSDDPSLTIPDPLAGSPLIGADRPAGSKLYRYDCYDAQVLVYAPSTVQPRYTLAWADKVSDVAGLGNPDVVNAQLAFMRQLKFRNPPDDTIVTWCSYHRGGDQSPDKGGMDLVLFLDGHVDRIAASKMQPSGKPWNYPYTVKAKL